ncbi:MAG: Flp family type IVb pilin [Phycisphaerae bacterium]
MVAIVEKTKKTLKSLHEDEQGADMIEYILILAAIALPFLALVLWFGKDITVWAKDLWTGAKAHEQTDPDQF